MIVNPKNATERAQWLVQFGHHWNPKYPNLQNLDAGRAKKMRGKEADARELVQSFQEMDANIALEVAKRHGRSLIPDGDIGPATAAVMNFKRCAMPDFAPPSNARFKYDDRDLQKAVESYQRWASARGSGSWPVGCDPTFPSYHSVIVAMDTSGASSTQKSRLDEALKYSIAAEAEIGQHVRVVLDAPVTPRAHHKVTFGPIAGSVIGYAYFPTPNTCNQTVIAKIDSTFNVSAITLANLNTHEWKGHSDGAEHTNGGIMNPSIITYNPLTWIGDKTFVHKQRWFGGKPLPLEPGPGPGPSPTYPPIGGILRGLQVGDRFIIQGKPQLTIGDKTYSYIVVPGVVAGDYRIMPEGTNPGF